MITESKESTPRGRGFLNSIKGDIFMTVRNKTVQEGAPIREGLFVLPSNSEERPYLLGSRCKKCGQVSFPPRGVCSKCFHDEFDPIPLSTEGKLYTYSIIRYPPPGLTAPYAVGYVDLPEGVRVFSILTGWDEGSLKVGMDLELVIDKFKEGDAGKPILTYKFRPIP